MSKLFIICGHGAGDPGACANGYSEAERVRVLGQRIKELGGDNVLLGDINRDYYQDNGISNLTISKDYQILELHMDSSDNVEADGAHVIIKTGYKPDKYDTALSKFLSEVFPGRSEIIVERSNLANVNRAAAKGYSYRLAECGFISNAGDLKVFNTNIDAIAIGILQCFEIAANGNSSIARPAEEETVTPTPTTKPSGYDEWVARLQQELNNQGFRDDNDNRLTVDGLNGPKTLQACPVVKRGANGGITKLIQERLRSVGFTSLSIDGSFGSGTEKAVKTFQSNRGLSNDGIVGDNTWKWLLKGTVM